MAKWTWLTLLVAVAVVVVTAGVWVFRGSSPGSEAARPGTTGRQTSATPPAASAPARAAPPVEMAPVEVGKVVEEVEALGTLAANELAIVAPEIAGLVTKIGFEEGEFVKRGQVLVELDASILKTELAQAEAELKLAQDTFERARQLAQRGTGTQVSLEQATAQLATAEAKLANVKARLDKTTINAPFDGLVGLRSAGIGTYVTVGQNLATVTEIDPIKVDFRAPELFLGRLKGGQTIQVSVDAIPGRTFEGRIYAIDPVIDINGRAIRLRAQIVNKDNALRPGLFARVTITTEVRENALLVPEAAVIPHGVGRAVYVVESGKARLVPVKTGKRIPGGKVEITEGLAAGMQVVTAGQARLRDGAPVEAVAPKTAGRDS
jgi:membrane fusion protein (multidrug efflux system)